MARNDNHDEDSTADIKINANGSDSSEEGLPEESMTDRISSLEQRLEEKNNSYNDLYERYLRIAADFDNYKKRMTKEKNDLVAYGNEELIKALLNVIDNLERALQHKGNESGSSKSLIEGVDLVYRQFLSTLEKFGLERINADKGTKFDPNYHQAVEHIETDDITPGMVVNEMIKGYLLKERLLRPSMVAVSKGFRKTLADENITSKDVKQQNNEQDKSENMELDNDKVFQINDTDDNINNDTFSIEIDTGTDDSNSDIESNKDDEILDLIEEDDVEDRN